MAPLTFDPDPYLRAGYSEEAIQRLRAEAESHDSETRAGERRRVAALSTDELAAEAAEGDLLPIGDPQALAQTYLPEDGQPTGPTDEDPRWTPAGRNDEDRGAVRTAAGEGAGGGVRDRTVNEVVEQVGDDPQRARDALAEETGPDGRNRSTLVEALEAVIARSETQ